MEADRKCDINANNAILKGHISFSVNECPLVFALRELKYDRNEELHFIYEIHTVILYLVLIVLILSTYVVINSRPWL